MVDSDEHIPCGRDFPWKSVSCLRGYVQQSVDNWELYLDVEERMWLIKMVMIWDRNFVKLLYDNNVTVGQVIGLDG